MTKQPGSGPIFPGRAEQPTTGMRATAASDPGGERWFGVSDSRGDSRKPDSFRVIGSAHGPRLLELLRAS
jgi:hypothetical protein